MTDESVSFFELYAKVYPYLILSVLVSLFAVILIRYLWVVFHKEAKRIDVQRIYLKTLRNLAPRK
ncbi:MAG: hypothetical protein SGI71_04735 [Verrucomicrobiota bacterium]|mgnify:CR=1 FL=1|nr:hypothetical protein [Verrucomicrobiota bacterium]